MMAHEIMNMSDTDDASAMLHAKIDLDRMREGIPLADVPRGTLADYPMALHKQTFESPTVADDLLQAVRDEKDAAIQAHLQTPEMQEHIRRLYNRQVKYASPKSTFATIHQPSNGRQLRTTKVRKPAGMSGRQWKRARKALRKIAESGCE